MLGVNAEARLNALTRGCLIGGVIASLAAIIGYFRIFPSLNELLLLYTAPAAPSRIRMCWAPF